MTPEPLLRLQGWSLERRMSGTTRTVLAGIDLELVPGRWTAVLGANGSGKSSLLKFLASDESPLRHPAAIMFQDPDEQIFATSVARELTLGRRGLDPGPILERFGLPGTAARDPRLLSAGQKQRLALAVAVSADPRVLFCDEPTALQDPDQAGWILDELDRWRTGGGALLTATCDRREAERADWLVILEDGRIREQGPAAGILAGERARALLGDEIAARPESFVGGGGGALSLEGVGFVFDSDGGGLDDVTAALDPGARLGVTGPNGCGKSTLLAAMAGARRPDRGLVRLGERRLYRKEERDLDHGRALLAPQFPEYLFTRSTVAEEILLDPVLAGLGPGEFLTRVGLGDDLRDRNPHDLSCGQKRRLALGLVILAGRSVVLLDEPTAALDRAGRARVLELLTALPPETVLVIASHDRDFLARAGCAVLDLGPSGTGP